MKGKGQSSSGGQGNIDTESGFRLPFPKRDDLDDYGKQVYDRRVGKGARSLRGLRGPSGIRLHSPKMADYSSALSQYLRYETGLDARTREIVILATARELDSQFEWTVHEPEARKEGVSDETIDIIGHRRPTDGMPEKDAVVIQFARQLFTDRRVKDETFARALEIFGSKGLVDLVALMVNYAGTAFMLLAFDMQLDTGQKPSLPSL